MAQARDLHQSGADIAQKNKGQQAGDQDDVADALRAHNEAIRGNGPGNPAMGEFPELAEPHLLLASPAGSLHMAAKDEITIKADRVNIEAKTQLNIKGGGSYAQYKSGLIDSGTSGADVRHAASHSMVGPSQQGNPSLPEGNKPGKGQLELTHQYAQGRGLRGASYEVIDVLGQVRKGTLDGNGFAAVSGLAPGGTRVTFGKDPSDTWAAGSYFGNGSVRTRYWYDPLGRRIGKFSEPIVHVPPDAGSRYGASEYARRAKEEGLGGVVYGWDGDQLAWETDYVRQQTLHYVHEPHSFVPLLQATTRVEMLACMLQRPQDVAREYEGADGYDMDRDPLYNGSWHPGLDDKGELIAPLTRLHFYQCDHLGTPQALTDEQGEIAWEANYRAWGQARITIQEAARKAGLHNPIRFQGQYFDEESGLHYNRYRYYDPHAGRFISRDPIGLLGGINFQQYAPNPIEWIDPLGLAGNRANRRAGRILQDQDAASGGHAYGRHGAHTTMPQQEHRSRTGVPPDQPCRRPRNSGPNSTRFLSNVDQLDAIQRGKAEMNRTGNNEATIDMKRVIGEGYRRGGGCPETTQHATVVRGPNGIITAYPDLDP